MTKVELYLYDTQELLWYAQFHDALLKRRAELAASLKETPVPQQTSVPNEAVVDAVYDIPAAPAPAPAPAAKMDLATAKKLFNEYINNTEIGGFEKARAKLDAYGAKQLKDIPAEKLAEFIASLG